MDKVIIGISYIVVICFFVVLVKFRKEPKKDTPNIIYILIVLIFLLLTIWSIFRNI